MPKTKIQELYLERLRTLSLSERLELARRMIEDARELRQEGLLPDDLALATDRLDLQLLSIRKEMERIGEAFDLLRAEALAAAAETAPPEAEAAHSLLELEGLGAEVWAAVDAQEYVSRLRGEWDDGR